MITAIMIAGGPRPRPLLRLVDPRPLHEGEWWSCPASGAIRLVCIGPPVTPPFNPIIIIMMQRVESNGNWSLFCPNEAPGLADTCGEEFVKLYEK